MADSKGWVWMRRKARELRVFEDKRQCCDFFLQMGNIYTKAVGYSLTVIN